VEALSLPSHQNLKRRALPEDPRNNDIAIEDRLDRHFDLRLTLAMADFNCAFLIPSSKWMTVLGGTRIRCDNSFSSF